MFFKRAKSLVSAVCLSVLTLCPVHAEDFVEDRTMVSVFGGRMTANSWGDILSDPGGAQFVDSWLAGISIAREWPLFDIGYFGIEAQLVRHWGVQDLWEVAAPFYLRSRRPESVFLPSLAYGLGLSYTSKAPQIEVDRKGESQNVLAYWFIELEFGGKEPELTPYVRLHHRSDAYGVFPTDTSSNAVVFGLRKSF